MATPEKCLFVFTTKLGSKKALGPEDSRGESNNKLPCFLDGESSKCSFPSLSLVNYCCTAPSEESIEHLKSPVELRKQLVSIAPKLLLKNISRSFGTMIDNRIHQVNLMLVANAHNDSMDMRLSKVLSSDNGSPTCFTSAETIFRPLDLNKGFTKMVGRLKVVILPLVFKTVVSIKVLGIKDINVSITAPGTIIGTFGGACSRLQTAEVTLDTASLYSSMTSRCDQVVQEAFEVAALLSAMETTSKVPAFDAPSTGRHRRVTDNMQRVLSNPPIQLDDERSMILPNISSKVNKASRQKRPIGSEHFIVPISLSRQPRSAQLPRENLTRNSTQSR